MAFSIPHGSCYSVHGSELYFLKNDYCNRVLERDLTWGPFIATCDSSMCLPAVVLRLQSLSNQDAQHLE